MKTIKINKSELYGPFVEIKYDEKTGLLDVGDSKHKLYKIVEIDKDNGVYKVYEENDIKKENSICKIYITENGFTATGGGIMMSNKNIYILSARMIFNLV